MIANTIKTILGQPCFGLAAFMLRLDLFAWMHEVAIIPKHFVDSGCPISGQNANVHRHVDQMYQFPCVRIDSDINRYATLPFRSLRACVRLSDSFGMRKDVMENSFEDAPSHNNRAFPCAARKKLRVQLEIVSFNDLAESSVNDVGERAHDAATAFSEVLVQDRRQSCQHCFDFCVVGPKPCTHFRVFESDTNIDYFMLDTRFKLSRVQTIPFLPQCF